MIARFNNLSLGGKLGLLVVLCLIPTGLVLFANLLISQQTRTAAEDECLKLSGGQLDHVLQGIQAMCAVEQEGQEQQLDVAIKLTRRLVQERGGLHADLIIM
jgi:hypothetical protein